MAGVMDELTPVNFIQKIKAMDKATRNQLKLKDLVNLIVQAPNEIANPGNMQHEINQLVANYKLLSGIATNNQAAIAELKVKNSTLERSNIDLEREIASLKEDIPNGTNGHTELDDLRKQINEIEQYLRVNNLEIQYTLSNSNFTRGEKTFELERDSN